MDIAAFLEKHWQFMSMSPLTFILFGLLVASITFALMRVFLGVALEASRERLGGAKEEIARLKGEKDELISRLETHGEDIEKLKTDLAALPRIHVSDRPPGPDDIPRDGDLWVQYHDNDESTPEDAVKQGQ